jgi:hypothetical protein
MFYICSVVRTRIEIRRNPMSHVAEHVLFENADWTVTSAGLEHKDNGYFIEREHLDARRSDGLWTWPLHMLEKTWCMPHAFAEAFGAAVLAYGLADRNLAASFVAALRSRLNPGVIAVIRRASARPIWHVGQAANGDAGWSAGLPQSCPEARLPLR